MKYPESANDRNIQDTGTNLSSLFIDLLGEAILKAWNRLTITPTGLDANNG